MSAPTMPKVAEERKERQARQQEQTERARIARQAKLERFLQMRKESGKKEIRKNRAALRLAEELVTEYGGLVGHALRLQIDKIPQAIEAIIGREDLLAAGRRGLHEALLQYDPARGSSFHNYALQVIRWEMIHAVRDLDMLTRYGRDKAKRSREAADEVARKLGREATAEEAAAEARITASEYREHRTWEQRTAVTAITEPIERYLSETEGDPLEQLCKAEEVLEALEAAQDDPELAEAAQEVAEAVESVRSYFSFGNGTVKRDGTGKPKQQQGRAA